MQGYALSADYIVTVNPKFTGRGVELSASHDDARENERLKGKTEAITHRNELVVRFNLTIQRVTRGSVCAKKLKPTTW
jgi:hypothetical protein